MDTITESESPYNHLERLSALACVTAINRLDQHVAEAVAQTLPAQAALVDALVARMRRGGRLFYVGAGTSGRLGVLDAAECPPTFGVDANCVVGLMAGGQPALSQAVELAEDNAAAGRADISKYQLTANDAVIGISASGSAAYVLAACALAGEVGALTGCITCNPTTALAEAVTHPIVCVVGPEFVTGSTRMKAGTATKLILNALSTTVMIQLGHVLGNQMIDMQLNNAKLKQRAVRMLVQQRQVSENYAKQLLATHGTVRAALAAVDRDAK